MPGAHDNPAAAPGTTTTADPASPPAAKLPDSPSISVALHGGGQASPNTLSPPLPKYHTPMRQHKRTPSQVREIPETLDAVADIEDDDEGGFTHHRINQYTIQNLIGHGSYASVHLATDRIGNEYAVKEFSKARMRKRAKSMMMRQGPFRAGPFDGGPGRPIGMARMSGAAKAEADDALHFIREEVAIMKKLNHPNLVALIEVLDDPDQDSLYMVLEMCKKGAIINVDLGKTAKPYDLEASRTWFRDLILGIEYLHAQKIIHRDIKPDNLLISEDDVLKIADFGVSEMFGEPDDMRTAKSAGSPAFLPPELCVSHHGDVAGPPCDIWSMGVTLYCLRYGRIPFERDTIPGIYEAISTDTAEIPEDEDKDFADLMSKILDKDPSKRITMDQLRQHSWVTKDGTDPLLSTEENCANPIEPPNALELNHAFTRRVNHLLCVLKAIGKFKGLLRPKSGRKERYSLDNSMKPLGSAPKASGETSASSSTSEDEVARLVEEMRMNKQKTDFKSLQPVDEDLACGTVNTCVRSAATRNPNTPASAAVILGIGTGGVGDDFCAPAAQQVPEEFVSESPTVADFDVYDRAFETEIKRIRSQRGHSGRRVYPNKVVEGQRIRARVGGGGGAGGEPVPSITSSTSTTGAEAGPAAGSGSSGATEGTAGNASAADNSGRTADTTAGEGAAAAGTSSGSGFTLASVVARAMRETKS